MSGIICPLGERANRHVAVTRFCLGVFHYPLFGLSGLVNDGFPRLSEIKLWFFYISDVSEDITTVKEVVNPLPRNLVVHCGANCHCVRPNTENRIAIF